MEIQAEIAPGSSVSQAGCSDTSPPALESPAPGNAARVDVGQCGQIRRRGRQGSHQQKRQHFPEHRCGLSEPDFYWLDTEFFARQRLLCSTASKENMLRSLGNVLPHFWHARTRVAETHALDLATTCEPIGRVPGTQLSGSQRRLRRCSRQ